MNYATHFSTTKTPQSEPIPGREEDMAPNNAGGATFTLDKWARLHRFLILGSEGGTYYVQERSLTIDNAKAIVECAKEDPARLLGLIVKLRLENRVPKLNPMIFALAICCKMAGPQAATEGYRAVRGVCQTPTQLFLWMKYLKELGGLSGSGIKRAIGRWYNEGPANRLAYHLAKYQKRKGFTHRDALRIGHVKPCDKVHDALFGYAMGKVPVTNVHLIAGVEYGNSDLDILNAAEVAKTCDAKTLGQWIGRNLPWECVPTAMRKDPVVNEALLRHMPMTALIRQLGRISATGILKPMSDASLAAIGRITNAEAIDKSRVHPIQLLAAYKTYEQGHGERGSLSWDANQGIIEALDKAFHLSFGNVEATGKRMFLALDVSGSMGWGNIAGIPGLKPSMASAALAMAVARTEQPGSYCVYGFAEQFRDLDITPTDSLADAMLKTSGMTFGRTDCAQPMLYAAQHEIPVDVFMVFTDNETWCGKIQPVQALAQYRKQTGIDAKLIVVGMTATEFTIADPQDAGMLDIVGFDAGVPALIREFVGAKGSGGA
jgi:60 kDa SS-A/Ro ribonucleoprotein